MKVKNLKSQNTEIKMYIIIYVYVTYYVIYTVPTQTSRREKSANQNSIKLLENES